MNGSMNQALNIDEAAAVAFGLLTARATSAADKAMNTEKAAKIIWEAINGGGTPTEEKFCQATCEGGHHKCGKVFLDLDGSVGGRHGCQTIDADKVVASLLEQVKELDEEDAYQAEEAEYLRQAAILICKAYPPSKRPAPHIPEPPRIPTKRG